MGAGGEKDVQQWQRSWGNAPAGEGPRAPEQRRARRRTARPLACPRGGQRSVTWLLCVTSLRLLSSRTVIRHIYVVHKP